MNSNVTSKTFIMDEDSDDDVPLVTKLKNIKPNANRKHDLEEEDDDDDDIPLIAILNQQKKQSIDSKISTKKEQIKKQQISQPESTKTALRKKKSPKNKSRILPLQRQMIFRKRKKVTQKRH